MLALLRGQNWNFSTLLFFYFQQNGRQLLGLLFIASEAQRGRQRVSNYPPMGGSHPLCHDGIWKWSCRFWLLISVSQHAISRLIPSLYILLEGFCRHKTNIWSVEQLHCLSCKHSCFYWGWAKGQKKKVRVPKIFFTWFRITHSEGIKSRNT